MESLARAVATGAAMATLLCIMLGVGLSLTESFSQFRSRLSAQEIHRAVLVNFVVVPLIAVGLARLCLPLASGLSAAILLFGCLPAGPIALLFVSPRPEAVSRSTAVVLLLQLLSVPLAPLLLVVASELLIGRTLLGHAGSALLSLFVQMALLELLPITVGVALLRWQPHRAKRHRRWFRLLANLSLGVSAAGFGYVFRERFTDGTLLLALVPFAVLSLGAWTAAFAVRSAARADAAQIAGLRNISLALVLASSLSGQHEAVIFVLLGAAVTTGLAPVLRLVTQGARPRQWGTAGTG